MKKILPIVLISLFILSCGSDKDEEAKLSTISIAASFDTDGIGPEYRVYLFDLDRTYPKDGEVHLVRKSDMDNIVYMKDVNDEYIYPIYSSSYKEKPNKDNDGKYKNETTSIIFWSDLPANYKNIYKGNFAIAIVLEWKQYSFKKISWNDNSTIKINKTFTRDWDLFYDGMMEEW